MGFLPSSFEICSQCCQALLLKQRLLKQLGEVIWGCSMLVASLHHDTKFGYPFLEPRTGHINCYLNNTDFIQMGLSILWMHTHPIYNEEV